MTNWKDVFSYTIANGKAHNAVKTTPANNKPYYLYQLKCPKIKADIGGKYSVCLSGAHITAFQNNQADIKEVAEYACHLTLNISLLANNVVFSVGDYHIYLRNDGTFYWDDRRRKGWDKQNEPAGVNTAIHKIGNTIKAEQLLTQFYYDCSIDKENSRSPSPDVLLNSAFKKRKGMLTAGKDKANPKLISKPTHKKTVAFADAASLQLAAAMALEAGEKNRNGQADTPPSVPLAKARPILTLKLNQSANKFTLTQIVAIKDAGPNKPIKLFG